MNTKLTEKKILEKITTPKICSYCKELKQYEELVRRSKYKGTDIYSTTSYCKKCRNKRREEQRKNNPTEKRTAANKERGKRCNELHKTRHKNNRLLREYGVDINWYHDNILLQNFKCKICNSEIDEFTGVIDHCHSTLKVRGVLCRLCNSGLGMFKDNLENLLKAVEYLKE